MDLSLTLAKIIGVYGLIVAMSALLNLERVHLMVREMMENEALMYLGALMSLTLGLILITIHNDTTPDYHLLITAFGWVSFILGVLLLLVPDLGNRLVKGIGDNRTLLILVILLVLCASSWLTIEGFELKDKIGLTT